MSAKRWKRGDVGPDGRVFWRYKKERKNGEWWVTPEKYESNREKIAEKERKRYKANREKELERLRKYRESNREKISDRMRKYNEVNREKILECNRKHYESNREKMLEYNRKRRRQQSADQFFIMQAAANEIQEALKSIQP